MNYLAINTASSLEVLIKHGSNVRYALKCDKTTASTHLLPLINEMLNSLKASLNELDFFACITGPGSFTGIRIGVTTINSLGYALNKPLLGLTLFDYIASNQEFPLTAIVNGTGNVCYLQNFDFNAHPQPPICIQNDRVFECAKGKILACSPFLEGIEAFSPSESLFKSAVERAYNIYPTQKQLIPVYLRRSQAEREKGEL